VSSASIAERILESVASFEAEASSAWLVKSSIETHSSAFEGVPRLLTDRLTELGLELLREDLSEIEREQLGWSDKSGETASLIKDTLKTICRYA
jgi:hypothetical protein